MTEKVPDHEHELRWQISLNGHMCDLCREDGSEFFRCTRGCDWDLCRPCFDKIKARMEEEKKELSEQAKLAEELDKILDAFATESKEGEAEEEDPADRPIFMREMLWSKYKKGVDTDVTFRVGKKDVMTLRAHKLVLACSSPLFEAMLFPDPEFCDNKEGDLTELEAQAIEVHLPNTDPRAFECLLECIYTDETEVDEHNVTLLTNLAIKYQVEKLKMICVEFLKKDVTADNFCTLFESAPKLLGEPDFGIEFLRENTEEILAKEGFLSLSKERVQRILQDEKLSVEEDVLFDAMLRWADKHCTDPEKESPKTLLADLIPLIRFPLMSIQTIAGPVTKSGLLSSQELLSIFHYVAIKDEKVRSQVQCSFNTKERGGRSMVKLAWDPSQSWTYNVYTVRDGGRTAEKTGSNGSIYILRTTSPIEAKGKAYWEVHCASINNSSTDLQLGVAQSTYSWTSSWLKGNGTIWIELSGTIYNGTNSVGSAGGTISSDDRFGFELDFGRRTITILRGKGKKGGPMKKIHEGPIDTGMQYYPVFAARATGNIVSLLK